MSSDSKHQFGIVPSEAAPDQGLILRAREIDKIFMSPMAPMARFMTAVRNRPATGKVHKVLKGIDLDIYQGQTIGIMGRNGAGKSTLLGILAGVLPATNGHVHRYGRISVLLELGAGFDQNLTGRENVRVYCSLMGMSGREIERAMPSIERFADIGDYFDLPARTYSSGMFARSAFAAAIHVDADLIVVDETLSVGDASFRVKCYTAIERMQAEGKTFLMVSHNQNIIANFCTRAIVLEKGEKIFDGAPIEAVSVYKRVRLEAEAQVQARANVSQQKFDSLENEDERLNDQIKLVHLDVKQINDAESGKTVEVVAKLISKRRVERPVFNLIVRNANGALIGAIETNDPSEPLTPFEADSTIEISTRFRDILAPGAHFLSVAVWEINKDVRAPLALYENCSRIDVVKRGTAVEGLVDLGFTWKRFDTIPGEKERVAVAG
jgi:ABC-type polysaccharide/polyol phosphate transport system ATPase subunit